MTAHEHPTPRRTLRRMALLAAVVLAAAIGMIGPSPAEAATPARPRCPSSVSPLPTRAALSAAGCVSGRPRQNQIVVECNGPVIAVDGASTSTIPCPSAHDVVTLPVGIDHIQCTQGIAGARHLTSYWRQPNGVEHGVTCVVGDVVELGAHGSPVQVRCPAEGVVTLTAYGFFTGPSPSPQPCTPGLLAPGAGGPAAQFTTAIDWTGGNGGPSPYPFVAGEVTCPQAGQLELYFLGEGAPSSNPGAATGFACTPGSPVDVTRLP